MNVPKHRHQIIANAAVLSPLSDSKTRSMRYRSRNPFKYPSLHNLRQALQYASIIQPKNNMYYGSHGVTVRANLLLFFRLSLIIWHVMNMNISSYLHSNYTELRCLWLNVLPHRNNNTLILTSLEQIGILI